MTAGTSLVKDLFPLFRSPEKSALPTRLRTLRGKASGCWKSGGAGGTASCRGFRGGAPKPYAQHVPREPESAASRRWRPISFFDSLALRSEASKPDVHAPGLGTKTGGRVPSGFRNRSKCCNRIGAMQRSIGGNLPKPRRFAPRLRGTKRLCGWVCWAPDSLRHLPQPEPEKNNALPADETTACNGQPSTVARI